MKLFSEFEAVRFPEENLIFVTHDAYIYYIYSLKYKRWRKHRNAGNDQITVSNYPDIRREELIEAMGGIFPQKETDFMRLCNPSELCIGDMLDLFCEDYPNYMSDRELHFTIHHFLLESDICYKSYLALRKLLDSACECLSDNEQVIIQIKELSLAVIGRDIFKKEIGIVDGHDSSSYFWIMPVRVLELSNTDAIDSVAEMRSIEISIEEDDVDQYLTPFLYKYFDGELEANKKRTEYCWTDDDGTEHAKYITGFEWYLTHNFYTFDAVKNIINDIRDTADALASGRANEFTAELRKKRGFATYELVCAKNLSEEQINAYNASRPQEDDTKIDLIVDFYRRFIYRMEYMIKVGQEKGYNLISFMGP